MNSYQFDRNLRCGIDNCISTQYYVNAGLTYCTNGHLVEGIIEIDNTNDLTKSQSSRRKKITSSEHKKKSKILYGNEGKIIFLRCFQQILRTQSWYLIHTHGITNELEQAIQNIWKHYLILLLSNKLFYKSAKNINKYQKESVTENLNNNIHYKIKKLPKLIDTIAICYLGLLNIRSTITISTLCNLMESGKIPYMKALFIIPTQIRKSMEPQYQIALSPMTFPSYEKVLNATYSIFSAFYDSYKIIFPPLNIYPILISYIQNLCLPLELILPTLKLAYQLNITFTNEPLEKYSSNVMPEVILLAILLISTRIYFGIDHHNTKNSKNYNHNNLIDWDVWMTTIKSSYNKLTHFNCTRTDIKKIPQISTKEMDNYLDYLNMQLFNKSYIKVPQTILNIFPLNDPKELDNPFNSTHDFYGSLKLLYITNPSIIETIFKNKKHIYKIFPLSSNLPEITKTLISKGAETIGITEFKLRKIMLDLEKQCINLNDILK
ncbi:hypothetical protein PMAC_000080 [Pneumocystis sp. 'macacae']|nr:hypothetical protein PMAC_000080 [Pneumocystis sp. 'macacae']